MPRATLPPTPSSSTDIPGQDGTKQLATLQMSFELPPPAMPSSEASRPPTAESPLPMTTDTPYQASPKSATYPLQVAEAVKARRRSSAAQGPAKDSFALPPPPTRSRKIIQMKPRGQEEPRAEASSSKAMSKATGAAPAPSVATPASASKKKQPSATSAAGRKIARKTAHSLIERRRRSKMNEEFAVLKNMIPACTGEMHKLAILQASIEYVRYLEDCVAKLQARREDEDPQPTTPTETYNPEHKYVTAYHEQPTSPDVEMTGSDIPSPPLPHSHQPSISPALPAQDAARHRHDSYSSAASDQRALASFQASPAFGPQPGGGGGGGHGYASAAGSALTSPALAPLRDRDLDHEATAALLMLNSDRRSAAGGASAGRGMSVRDLLST